MTTPSDTFIAALGQISSSEEAIREEAFVKLVARSRPLLHAMLSRSLASESDRDDVIQEIFHRLWRSRDRLEFPSIGAWWRLLRTMARNCTIDHLRMIERTLNMDDPEFKEIPPSEVELVDALLEAMEDRRALYRLADEVFLELPANVSDRVRTRHLLAAKLLLIDKMHWQEVCQIVNSGANDDEVIDRNDLDRLLTDRSLLNHLAFSELHWENERLTAFLLDSGYQRKQVDEGEKRSWTEDEMLAVQLRFQYIMLLEQIVNRLSGRIKKPELVEIFDSCVANFPFVEIMNRLLKDVGQFTDAPDLFASSGLWNRLVFEYYSHDGLPHRDIYDRTFAASQVVGYELTLGMLNVGLSNGRLFKKLAEHLARKETL